MFDRETHKNKVRVLFNLNRFDRVVNEIEVIESLFGTSCYNYYLKGINFDFLTTLNCISLNLVFILNF